MKDTKGSALYASVMFAVLIWGGLWGIFEATAGYLLHWLPFSVGWLIWYPVACFFMANVYRGTRRLFSILLIGLLSALVKMLNLLLPGSIDRVINPALSILFEALAMAGVLFAAKRFLKGRPMRSLSLALAALGMNTGWRLLYMLYLLLLAPGWIRDVSVISSTEALITFFVVHNLLTSLVLWIGAKAAFHITRPIRWAEHRIPALFYAVPAAFKPIVKGAAAIFLLCASIALQMLL